MKAFDKLVVRLAVALIAAALLLTAPFPVSAENLGPGGGSRVIVGDQVVGAYQIWMTTSPEPVQVGTLTLDIRLTDPRTGQKDTNATIDVQLTNSSDGSIINAQATHHDSGNAIDYASHIQIDVPASYNAAVHVNGPAGVSDVNFVVPVLAARSATTLLLIGLPFLVVLGIAGGIWYRRMQAARPPAASGDPWA